MPNSRARARREPCTESGVRWSHPQELLLRGGETLESCIGEAVAHPAWLDPHWVVRYRSAEKRDDRLLERPVERPVR